MSAHIASVYGGYAVPEPHNSTALQPSPHTQLPSSHGPRTHRWGHRYPPPNLVSITTNMFKAADTDGDGEISLEEFKTIMRAGPDTAP